MKKYLIFTCLILTVNLYSQVMNFNDSLIYNGYLFIQEKGDDVYLDSSINDVFNNTKWVVLNESTDFNNSVDSLFFLNDSLIVSYVCGNTDSLRVNYDCFQIYGTDNILIVNIEIVFPLLNKDYDID